MMVNSQFIVITKEVKVIHYFINFKATVLTKLKKHPALDPSKRNFLPILSTNKGVIPLATNCVTPITIVAICGSIEDPAMSNIVVENISTVVIPLNCCNMARGIVTNIACLLLLIPTMSFQPDAIVGGVFCLAAKILATSAGSVLPRILRLFIASASCPEKNLYHLTFLSHLLVCEFFTLDASFGIS